MNATPLWWGSAIVFLLLTTLWNVMSKDIRSEGTAYLIGAVLGVIMIQALVCLVVYGVARLMGKGRTGVGVARLVFITVGVFFFLDVVGTVGRASDTNVTADERHALRVTRDSIRHAGFGFALPLPGPDYVVSAEQQQRVDSALATTPTMAAWFFRDTITGHSIAIMVTKLTRVNETDFRAFATGVRRGFHEAKVLGDSVVWDGAAGEYRLDILHPAGVYISMRCLPNRGAEGWAVICVQATTARLHELEWVTNSLTLARVQ